jgi:hypothetical protein
VVTRKSADAKSYFAEFVEPAIADFRANPTSRRRAFEACVATFHCVDYIKRKPQNLRRLYRNESPDFAIIERAANAFKHTFSLDGVPLDVTSVFTRPPARSGVARCGLSRCGDRTGSVEIWNESGSNLLRAVGKAAEFLRGKM